MSIYQDWTPVNVGKSGKMIKKDYSKEKKEKKEKKEEEEEEMPKKIEWPIELRLALQQLRNLKKISQTELAKQLNLPSTIISDIEGNKIKYNANLFKKIYRYLGGDTKELNFPKEK